MKNVLKEFHEYVKNDNTKISQKIYNNILDYDMIHKIIIYNNRYWIEASKWKKIPKYFYEYLDKYMKKEYPNVKYLYD